MTIQWGGPSMSAWVGAPPECSVHEEDCPRYGYEDSNEEEYPCLCGDKAGQRSWRKEQREKAEDRAVEMELGQKLDEQE